MRKRRNQLILAAILVFGLVTRLWRVWEPSEYYFDEVYHAYTAGFYATNDPAGYEWWHTSPQGVAIEWLHPPISKLLMGFSVFMIGDHGLGWRLPGVVFGVLTLWATYLLGKEISGKEEVGLLAGLLASFDGLLLTQSRIAMNDIYVTFFIVMALVFYWRQVKNENNNGQGRWLVWSGVMAGLAVATKWSGVFVLGIMGLWEVVRLVKGERKWEIKSWAKKIVAWGVLPIGIYLLSYGQWWLQGHSWTQFRELHKQIWWYQTNLEATHPWQSKPWQWVMNIKPVWFWVDYKETREGNIYALANPVISWLGLAAMGWLGWQSGRRKNWAFGFLVLAYLVVWIPWSFSPRIMFYYHYAPAIPMLAIAVALMIRSMYEKWYSRQLARIMVVVSGIMFLGFYPYWTGMLVPREWLGAYRMAYEWPKVIGWQVP